MSCKFGIPGGQMVDIDEREMVSVYARMKKVDVSFVVLNMSRDFSRYCYKNTPLAKKSKSEFYVYTDKLGKLKFLPARQVENRKGRVTKKRRAHLNAILADVKDRLDEKGNVMLNSKGKVKKTGALHKVRIAKGWSRASWTSVFHALDMARYLKSSDKPKNIPEERIRTLSEVMKTAMNDKAEISITDRIQFNPKYYPNMTNDLIRGGFQYASDILTKDFERQLNRLMKDR